MYRNPIGQCCRTFCYMPCIEESLVNRHGNNKSVRVLSWSNGFCECFRWTRLVTINDRLTSKVWIRKLSGKDAAPLALKTIEALQPIKNLIHTITADNGKEFAKHQEIAEKMEISFYFCKPFHSWERGANENMNGLIRQYIPKGTDFSGITDEFVSWVEDKLNNRPRKRLGYLTPNEKFNLLLTN